MADVTPVKVLICPYCGDPQPTNASAAAEVGVAGAGAERCRSCFGLFEPLSRQATHNAMGPWFVRDPQRPFQPGCSYDTLVRLVQRGKVTKLSILRGPTTRQFWTVAKRVPGLAHLLGYCHECNASVDPGDHGCHACGVTFGAFLDRNFLGLPEYRPLPWEQERHVDDPLGRTWHGLPTIRDHTGPSRYQGLSSFASDEELRGEGGPMSETPPMTEESASVVTLEENARASSAHNTEVTLRLMQRRASRQQRTIYRLTVLSTALALFAVVLIAWIAALLTRPAQPAVVAPVVPSVQEVERAEADVDADDEFDELDRAWSVPLQEADVIETPPVVDDQPFDDAPLDSAYDD